MPLGPARREEKKMGHKDDWAEMVLGYAERKKEEKVFRF
jgi:hypothetical protein